MSEFVDEPRNFPAAEGDLSPAAFMAALDGETTPEGALGMLDLAEARLTGREPTMEPAEILARAEAVAKTAPANVTLATEVRSAIQTTYRAMQRAQGSQAVIETLATFRVSVEEYRAAVERGEAVPRVAAVRLMDVADCLTNKLAAAAGRTPPEKPDAGAGVAALATDQPALATQARRAVELVADEGNGGVRGGSGQPMVEFCHDLPLDEFIERVAPGNFDGDIDIDGAIARLEGWIPKQFILAADGVYRLVQERDKKGEVKAERWQRICGRLEVVSEIRTPAGDGWSWVLRITDRDGLTKEHVVPVAAMQGEGVACRELLAGLGLRIEPDRLASGAIREYLMRAAPVARGRLVHRLGWHDRTYVGARETWGPVGCEPYFLEHAGDAKDFFRQNGTLADWQEHVAALAVGNSRLILAICTAFAAPLLYLTGDESGGFNLRGNSSAGKSTALHAAGSVFGGGRIKGFLRQWNNTANGLEGIAANHSDALLCLDEMSQAAAQVISEGAYALANGGGKGRADRHGAARTAAEWRILFLSSGEIGLADKIAEEGRGRQAMAGQEVRVVDVEADAGAGAGLFEVLHGHANGDTFAKALTTAAMINYGTAFPEFIAKLVHDLDGVAPKVAAFRKAFLERHLPKEAGGQVSRVMGRFALVAAAGEMATYLGVLPWKPGTAIEGVGVCAADWLAKRGGVEPAEERNAISAVRRFLELHGSSRFELLGGLAPRDGLSNGLVEQKVINRAGFKRLVEGAENGEVEFLFLQEVFKTEVCAGMKATAVAQTLEKRGYLKRDGKSLQARARIQGVEGQARFYIVSASILSGDHEP